MTREPVPRDVNDQLQRDAAVRAGVGVDHLEDVLPHRLPLGQVHRPAVEAVALGGVEDLHPSAVGAGRGVELPGGGRDRPAVRVARGSARHGAWTARSSTKALRSGATAIRSSSSAMAACSWAIGRSTRCPLSTPCVVLLVVTYVQYGSASSTGGRPTPVASRRQLTFRQTNSSTIEGTCQRNSRAP